MSDIKHFRDKPKIPWDITSINNNRNTKTQIHFVVEIIPIFYPFVLVKMTRISLCLLVLFCSSQCFWIVNAFAPLSAYPSHQHDITGATGLVKTTGSVSSRRGSRGLRPFPTTTTTPTTSRLRFTSVPTTLTLWSPFRPQPPPPPSTSALLQQQIKELAKNSALIGNLRMITSKFSIEKTKSVGGGILKAVHIDELFFFFFMGWLFVPLLAYPQNYFREKVFKGKFKSFARSYTKLFANAVAQLFQIGFVVYLVDMLEIFLKSMGMKASKLDWSNTTGKSLFAFWVVRNISTLKRYILALQTRNVAGGELTGSAEIVDRLLDAFLYGLGVFLLLDSLKADFSAATKGLAALGGASTLVISLASQGLVSQIFYGLFLGTSKKIRKGDVVQFGEGKIKGFIAHMGWTDTLIRGGDGVMMSVPNKVLGE